MSLKLNVALIGVLFSQISSAVVPVEVIGSCKNGEAVKSSVTYTRMLSPTGEDDALGCTRHIEITEGANNYGAISCSNDNYLILKGTRYNLNTANNYSVNPAYSPGGAISQQSEWVKIVFNNIEYLCIQDEVSPSGKGADVGQYYIVENAFNASTPVLNYYLFDQDVMPTAATN